MLPVFCLKNQCDLYAFLYFVFVGFEMFVVDVFVKDVYNFVRKRAKAATWYVHAAFGIAAIPEARIIGCKNLKNFLTAVFFARKDGDKVS